MGPSWLGIVVRVGSKWGSVLLTDGEILTSDPSLLTFSLLVRGVSVTLALSTSEPPSLTLTSAPTRGPQSGLLGFMPSYRNPVWELSALQVTLSSILPPPGPLSIRSCCFEDAHVSPEATRPRFVHLSQTWGEGGVSVPQGLWSTLTALGLGPVNV